LKKGESEIMRSKNARKTVLITGATGGIGAKTALCFAENGWDVICHYNSSEKKAKELNKKIKKYKVNSYFLKADFLSEKEISVFIDKLKRFTIDSFVNNAGTYVVSRHFSKLVLSDMSKVFMVNVFAPIMISSRIFTGMKKRGFGRIVNISSIASKYGGSVHSLHYGCSKLALEGLTKTLAREGSIHNVFTNTIRPGLIDTEFLKKFPKDMAKRIKKIPVRKKGLPQDIADMIFYLGSDKNNFITNEIITISGGE